MLQLNKLFENWQEINEKTLWLGNNPAICEKYYCAAGQKFDPDVNKLERIV